MTAAKVLDTISRLPGMLGEASDAVSAYTQVKMSDAPRLLELPETECPTVWIRLPRNCRPKHWDNIDDQMVRLERNPHGHPLVGSLIFRRLGENTQLDLSSFSSASRKRRRTRNCSDEKPVWLQCG